LKPGDEVDCKGDNGPLGFRCAGVHGKLRLEEAIAQSCNVYFYEVSRRMGFERIRRNFAGFGFGAGTSLVKAEPSGLLPTDEWLRSKQEPATRDELWPGWVLLVGGGHGPIEVTLLQLAVAYAKLAEALPVRAQTKDAAAPAMAAIMKGLDKAVSDPDGLGRLARVPGFEIVGKTGSAEGGRYGDDAALKRKENGWFVGFAPATAPELVVAVLVLEGETGGKSAAPLAGKIFDAWKRTR
jgi:penicillin-binding protein 2